MTEKEYLAIDRSKYSAELKKTKKLKKMIDMLPHNSSMRKIFEEEYELL